MRVRNEPFIPNVVKKTDQPFAISSPEIIRQAIDIGMSIAYDMGELDLLFVGVLDASFMFIADVLRVIHRPCEMGFIKASSYKGQTPGQVTVHKPDFSVKGRTVVLMDTILDSGQTLDTCMDTLELMGTKDIYTAVMFEKKRERPFNIKVDYVGFIIPDLFVVGYGLDLDGNYRGMPNLMDVQNPGLPK